jgi:hypothetical protein
LATKTQIRKGTFFESAANSAQIAENHTLLRIAHDFHLAIHAAPLAA